MRSLVTLLALGSCAEAQLLSGFGQTPYTPLCSESCRRSFNSLMLSCTVMDHSGGHSHGAPTSPDCFADDSAYLTSVAWCMSDKCSELGVSVSEIEAYWERHITGSEGQVAPKWTYQEALGEVDTRPPAYIVESTDEYLNATSRVNEVTYLSQWNVLGNVRDMAVLESAYALIIFVVSVGIPIVLTWLGYMPFMGFIIDKAMSQVKPYSIYPALIGTYQTRSLRFLLGNSPTLGQTIYIGVIIILNVVLSAVGYRAAQPNAWFASQWQETQAYIMYRTGAFAFMLAPLLLLFSSRNNLLLWLANWSHSTYLLLHRWIARIFMLHVVIHSIIGLQIYAHYSQTSWWIWGAVATIATVILTLSSGLYVRKNNYELFLVTHIVLSMLILVGSWYHLIQWYASMGMYIPNTSGYEVWLYIAFCIWFFDRLVRVGRIVKNGTMRSKVTHLEGGYLRVDIPGVRWGPEPGKHAYIYFPTIHRLRPWENHPFSVIPTALLQASAYSTTTSLTGEDAEKNGHFDIVHTQREASAPVGITIFVKKATGITKYLESHESILTLLDGPYSNCHPRDVLRCDQILLIAGGIGITGILPWAYNHWNVKLFWSVRESAQCLVDMIDLSRVPDKEVRVGRRFIPREIIAEAEENGVARVGVVVCGPGALCDDVRAAVVAVAKGSKMVFELEVEAFSW
ncbi:hypothetical protein S7711_06676 [Stachybotrys chartarum IBT 7711]|uniref:FAD-binding FR-type domain-containing protein n=1 Tax=Stachybotrys chartarum (strain CBS 109288 / IBT 7711) TaxID=1280523 RepID=A0A084BB50_STACB|nr:hypothetical protein S7711_06676 [Stachybotrys chartarum IBT 7711]